MTDYALQSDTNRNTKRKSARSGISQDIIYDSIVLNRPITPYQLRQSVTRQQLLANLDDGDLLNNNMDALPVKNGTSKVDILRLEPIPKSTSSSQISSKGQSPIVQKKMPTGQSIILGQNPRKDLNQKSTAKRNSSNERAQMGIDKKPPSISTTVPSQSKISNSAASSLKQSGKPQSIEKPQMTRMSSLNQETEADQYSKSKARRGSEQASQYNKLTISALSANQQSPTDASILPSYSFIPKYSTSEPRPSSANSSRSRNSSSSGTPNMSDYNSVKKNS
jgi:hypothetical protein